MNIYLIELDMDSYDVYDSAVVYASDAEEARKIHPCDIPNTPEVESQRFGTWGLSKDVKVTYIGTNDSIFESCVICANFLAA